jgi:nitrite reductase/ring-hydroxylating ferredoxin subunit
LAETVVGSVAELPPGSRKIVRVGAVEVGVFNLGGRYYALPNICTHQFGPLCQGAVTGTVMARAENGFRRAWELDGQVLICPWHGLEFDLTTGRCLAYPRVKLRSYVVRVVDDQVVVSS